MVPIEQVNLDELKAVVKILNASPVVEKKVKLFGITKEDMLKNFAASVEATPDGGKLPDEVVAFYMKVVNPEAQGGEPAPAPTEDAEKAGEGKPEASEGSEAVDKPATEKAEGTGEPKPKEEKKAKAPKEPKPPKEPKAPKDPEPKSIYGHKIGTQSAKLDEMLRDGATLDQMVAASERTPNGVKGHIKHLKEDRGLEIEEITEEGKPTIYKVKAKPEQAKA